MANRYWIGNSGNWTDTAHWSTSSGGSGGSTVPTASDDVIFDGNSASANFTVTLDTQYGASLKSMNTSGLSFNMSLTKDPSFVTAGLKLYGNLNLNRFILSNGIYFLTLANLTVSMTTGSRISGLRIGNLDGTIGSTTSVSCQFLTDTAIDNLQLYYGSIDFNSNNFIGSVSSISPNTYAKTLDISGSTLNIQSSITINPSSNTTLVSTGSTIDINSSSTSAFFGGGMTYNDVNFRLSTTNGIYGSNTFNNLTIVSAKSLLIERNTTQTILGDLTIANGSSILTEGGGSNQHTLSKSSGTVSIVGGQLRGSRATGGANWYASNTTTNGGFNTGWVFAPPAPVASFTGTPVTGTRPFTVNFTDTSSNGATSWLWNFGDGTTSTAKNPSKTYSTIGTFSVTLTATNSSGSGSVTRTNYITSNPNVFTRSAGGTLLFGGKADRRLILNREAKGGIVFGGTTRAVIIRDAETIQDKRYLYKVSDEDGTYIETWKDVISELSFNSEINTIGSTTTVELARNSDSVSTVTSPLQTNLNQDILTSDNLPILVTTETRNQVGSGTSINYNNRVTISAFYGSVEPLYTDKMEEILTSSDEPILADLGAPNGKPVFDGFISEINSRYGTSETTVVQLSSYGHDLEQFPLTTTATSDTTTVAFNSVDPSDIAKISIDRFNETANMVQLSYTSRTDDSIQMTGSVVSYTFRNNKYSDVLDKVVELMPSNWYYRVGLGDNTLYFRERSATPQHIFFLGKHIKALDLKGSILDVVNHTLFTGGGDPALYVERKVTPAARTRRGLEVLSDSRVTLQNSAEIISEGKVEQQNKVQYRTTIEILTKQYDIESINVGESVGFRNFGNYVDGLVMQIVGLNYTPDVLQLQLETKPPTINKRLEDIQRNLQVTENQNTPATPV